MIQDIIAHDIWLMEPNYLKTFLETAQSKEVVDTLNAASNNEEMFFLLFDEKEDDGKKPYDIKDGVATIKMSGPLMKKASGFMAMLFGIGSMEKIGQDFNMALEDKDVESIFLHIDSPGGSVDGTATLSNIIYAGRGKKPIMAFADGSMTSAAYWIGSSADHIVMADTTTNIGSIGAIGVHQEISKAAEKAGVKFHVFASGDFKKRGNQFEPLSDKDKKYLQGRIEYFHNTFLDGVSRNLGIPKSKINKDARESKIFLGQEAVDVGIAHEILSKDLALTKLISVASGEKSFTKTETSKSKGGEKAMPDEKIKELEKTIMKLETDLEAKVAENATLDEAVFASDGIIVELRAELDLEKASNVESTQKIETLEAEVAENAPFVAVGKEAIDEVRADIRKINIQVKGDDANDELLEKQIETFGNDYKALVMLKTDLQNTREKLFKSGDINPDAQGSEQTKDQKNYELGKKIGDPNLVVVK